MWLVVACLAMLGQCQPAVAPLAGRWEDLKNERCVQKESECLLTRSFFELTQTQRRCGVLRRSCSSCPPCRETACSCWRAPGLACRRSLASPFALCSRCRCLWTPLLWALVRVLRARRCSVCAPRARACPRCARRSPNAILWTLLAWTWLASACLRACEK
jgi:hypothetical protein